ARLNLPSGPNTEQVVREIDPADPARMIEFDVFYTQYDPRRAAPGWIDIIFEAPQMNRIEIGDLATLIRPRASL
ncbi:MAG: DUF6478 family protein, partial [Pseudomonadota bacterium]